MVHAKTPRREARKGTRTGLGAFATWREMIGRFARQIAPMILGVTWNASPNQTRQPTPGGRLGFNRAPVARRGCAWR